MSFASAVLYSVFPSSSYESPDLSHENRLPHFFAISPGQELNTVLKRPHSLFVEIDGDAPTDEIIKNMTADAPGFALSLTTKTAYLQNTAEAISLHLNRRLGWQMPKCLQIQTCLQEAIINAIIHGNLEIEGGYQSISDFDEYFLRIERHMNEPAFRHRRITISAWHDEKCLTLTVGDEGKGYDLPTMSPDLHSPGGRGLFLIQSLADRAWIDPDRRTLHMTFTY